MDPNENYILSQNKLLEEKIDHCVHLIDSRLDKLQEQQLNYRPQRTHISATSKPFSTHSYLQFKTPYIRDFKNFSGPANEDVKQIRELIGTENVDLLIKSKGWNKESKQQLRDAVLDYCAQVHIVELIKQKNALHKNLQETPIHNRDDFDQKLNLIDEQMEQVKARKEERIFVPENPLDPTIDWCAISAKLANTHHDAQDCRLMWSNEIHWSVNTGDWTKDEDICLIDAVQKYGKNDWDSVAKELDSNRLPWQCCSRYNQEFLNRQYCGPTPMDEDDIDKIIEVINLCRIGNFVPWNQVMYFVQYFSLNQVKYQWQKLLSESKSNQPWTHMEDVLLLKSIEKFGDRDWNRISNYIPGRSNKSCRERYTMRLKFQRRALGKWRRKEDENLLSLVECFGINWSLISAYFPDRNNHQLRNRYELLKNNAVRVGPIKHRKVYRNSEGMLVSYKGRRRKLSSELEVDEKLYEIFSTYQTLRSSSKSLICRGAQDDYIFRTLIGVLRKPLFGKDFERNLLSSIIDRAIKERVTRKYELLSPCPSTLRGYKAWIVQQDYLHQFSTSTMNIEEITSTTDYHRILKIVMSLFLWPAILSRIPRPEIDVGKYQIGTIIERSSKNLYKIREIQKQIASGRE